ncbi:MAG: hypothetical protein ACR2NA_14090 [Solirubrobacterales bacterium]
MEVDGWLADPQVRTRHARDIDGTPAEVMAAARSLPVDDLGLMGRLVRWRIPHLPSDVTFEGLLNTQPFTVLAQGPHHHLAGLAGRIWDLRRDYARLADPEAFRSWSEPGTVRVLIAARAEAHHAGAARLIVESRVEPVDRKAAMRLRILWAAIGRFEGLIGSEALAAVQAQRAARSG